MREVTNWKTDFSVRCEGGATSTVDWDDDGSSSDKLEVAQIKFDDIVVNFEDDCGTVCFSKDGTYYSTAGALETDLFFYICRRSSTNTKCDVSDAEVPDEELDDVFAINWSRFGNITLEKWSKTKEDWVLQ